MNIRVSPHGGFLVEGTVSSGTLRTQDLLRAFANELERLKPFNSYATCNEARYTANELDVSDKFGSQDGALEETGQEVLAELIEELNQLASPHGFRFGASEGDGADFGFWKVEEDE